MKYWTLAALAAALAASGAIAQDRDAYNLDAATADLAVFHQLARDGVLRREDVRADVDFSPRFEEMDLDRNGEVTAAEMDRYIGRTYGVKSSSAAEDGYRRHAATRDLAAFHQLARGGALQRADVQAHPFSERFDDADANRDGTVTPQEMDRYVLERYGIAAHTAAGTSGSASVGSSGRARKPGAGSASAGSSGTSRSAPAAVGNSR